MKVLYSVKHYQTVIILIFNSHTLVRLEIVPKILCPIYRYLGAPQDVDVLAILDL